MKHQKTFTWASLFLLLLTTSCGCDQALPTITDLFAKQDCAPPVLLSSDTVNPTTFYFQFDEILAPDRCKILVNQVPTTNFLCTGKSLSLYLDSPLALATYCTVEARVEDKQGNSTRFTAPLWAKNTHPAGLLINEFTTKGTENNPDRVELLVVKSGNLAGLTISDGTGLTYNDRCILPDKKVWQGDYIVINFQAGNQKAAYVSQNLGGLGSNNGCLVVTETPEYNSTVLDAVLYGNLTTTSYEGFGSQSLKQSADYLVSCGQWNSSSALKSINSTHGTSTRSLCRYKAQDTNSSEDWYVADTKKATFGTKNTEEHYSSSN
ncbi:hypothetical protein [uncultured Sphaerochaeta sp.]|uniref:hypothetical protein n=1 Tax=uncultured Sphaerochaeta sp. TaxID=886478 RepID=UPI002A0A7AA0|nr:hypothetical protein [uncultured Sphaerochaeta sp.]